MKNYLSSGWLFGSIYNSLGKESAKETYIDWINAPTFSNWLSYVASTVWSRWATPEIWVKVLFMRFIYISPSALSIRLR